MPDAIENALLLIRERASRHGIKLERIIDDRLGDFTGDERKVKQVLVNLLANAVKFTPEGGRIKVEARLGDSAVIVSVTRHWHGHRAGRPRGDLRGVPPGREATTRKSARVQGSD